ncbi:unnamed protein product [Amoebophrya sp. A120]|nr:unnamed protein product [Amoebophrya sp. A120]|eukprot:GSA120T00018322001.1
MVCIGKCWSWLKVMHDLITLYNVFVLILTPTAAVANVIMEQLRFLVILSLSALVLEYGSTYVDCAEADLPMCKIALQQL